MSPQLCGEHMNPTTSLRALGQRLPLAMRVLINRRALGLRLARKLSPMAQLARRDAFAPGGPAAPFSAASRPAAVATEATETTAPAAGNGLLRAGGAGAAPTFQEAIARLQSYWASVGCAVWLPHNTEVRTQMACDLGPQASSCNQCARRQQQLGSTSSGPRPAPSAPPIV